jgi:hypothetical protein
MEENSVMARISRASFVAFVLLALIGVVDGAAYSQEYSGPNNTTKFAAGNWMAHGTTLTGPNLSDFQIPPLPSGAVVDYRQHVCEDRCWQDNHCVGWTYEGAALTESSHCYLKGGPFPDQAKSPSSNSGAIGEPNINRVGHEYKHQAANNMQECEEECGADAGCLGWTFVAHKQDPSPEGAYGIGICELKDEIGSPQEKEGCTSGYFLIVNKPAESPIGTQSHKGRAVD